MKIQKLKIPQKNSNNQYKKNNNKFINKKMNLYNTQTFNRIFQKSIFKFLSKKCKF